MFSIIRTDPSTPSFLQSPTLVPPGRGQVGQEWTCSDSFLGSKLDHVGTEVLFIRCLPGGNLASHGRTLRGQQKRATWERRQSHWSAWVTWVRWRQGGKFAVAWAILGSGLAIQPPCRERLPSGCWEAPAASCQACQFCDIVVWLQSSFQKVCRGLGLQLNQSPTSLSGLRKPGVPANLQSSGQEAGSGVHAQP